MVNIISPVNLYYLSLQEHPWVTKGGKDILPSTEQHCNVIEVSEEDLRNSVTLISRLSSLVRMFICQ